LSEANELTALGRELAKLPLDPRVGRMILEGRERGALAEVLVIAAALSVQDVRDRPMDAQQQADQQHAKFDDEKSEFSGYLKLWKWLGDARGGVPALPSARAQKDAARKGAPSQAVLPVAQRAAAALAAARQTLAAQGQAAPEMAAAPTHKLSNRQYEQLLRQNYISIRRAREWRDIHSQLLTVVTEHQWKLNPQPASYEALHLSMLAGLLGNVGYRPEDLAAGASQAEYLGARGIKFHRHPGAHLSKKPGRWIVVAELVETTRLFGRGIAAIEPQWLEEVGGHLLKKQLLDPHWEKKAGEVVALERATLYGLVVYNNRRVSYGRVDPHAAREIFIREALVAGEWETKLPFLAANQKLVAKVEELEHKSRRQDVLVDEELIYAFYDQQLPKDLCTARELEAWWRDASKTNPKLLQLSRDELMRHEAAGHHHGGLPAHRAPGRHRLRGQLPARAGRRQGRPDGDGAAVRAEPGQRRALRMAGARHAQGQDPGAAQEPAAKAPQPLRAAARQRGPAGRGAHRAHRLRPRRPAGGAAQTRARRDQPGRQTHRFQARHGQCAPVHELPGGGRTRPPAGPRAQPGRAESRARGPGARCVPGAGDAESEPGGRAGRGGSGFGTKTGITQRQTVFCCYKNRIKTSARQCRIRAPAHHHMELWRTARADGNPQRRRQPDRVSGPDRPRRCGHHRGVRRTADRRNPPPRRLAPAVRTADPRCAEIPGKEHPRSAENGRRVHATGHAGRTAWPDHRGGARPRLSAGAFTDLRGGLQAPCRRGTRPP
jgi:hypothetical protein